MTDINVETRQTDNAFQRPHGRREFLKRGAVAGLTVAYAVPLIETLRPSAVLAASPPPSNCKNFGSDCYVCSLTHGFGNGQWHRGGSVWTSAIQPALQAAQQASSNTSSPLYGVNNLTNGSLSFGNITQPGDLKDFLTGNNSCGIPDLAALVLLIELNKGGYQFSASNCTAGLGLYACVTVTSLSSSDRAALNATTTASVGAVVKLAIGKANTPTQKGKSNALCDDSALVALLNAMAQDISGKGGPFPGTRCSA